MRNTSASSKWLIVGIALGSSLLMLQSLQSQDKASQPKEAANGAAVGKGVSIDKTAHNDALFAHWLLIDNQNEVALAELAQQRATTDQVKEFAKHMIRDHGDFIKQLTPFVDGAGKSDAGDNAGKTEPDGASRASTGRPAGVGMIALKKELAEECGKSAREELEMQKGANFDQAYINHQILMHMVMLDTLNVFRRHATSDFAQLIDQGLKTTKMHLGEAKKIAASLNADRTNVAPSGEKAKPE